jgi:hypothetical protein
MVHWLMGLFLVRGCSRMRLSGMVDRRVNIGRGGSKADWPSCRSEWPLAGTAVWPAPAFQSFTACLGASWDTGDALPPWPASSVMGDS